MQEYVLLILILLEHGSIFGVPQVCGVWVLEHGHKVVVGVTIGQSDIHVGSIPFPDIRY
jgi:hypothetical protein